MRLSALAFPLLLSHLMPTVSAWGAAGHEIVATIAQIYLHPTVLPTMCTILDFHGQNPNEPPCHLAPIATWADKNRWRMRWSGPLHYINSLDDFPSKTCQFPGPRGWGGKDGINVIHGIRNTTNILQEYINEEVSVTTANEAFKFLVHFLGDLHQPLHLVGRARGGNGIKVLFDGRTTKLHTVWDSLLIAKALRSIPQNYTRPLPVPEVERNLRGAIYDPYIRRIIWEGLSNTWKHEIDDWLSCPADAMTLGQSSFVPLTLFQRLSSFLPPMFPFWSSPVPESDDSILCPYAWAQPIHEMNCDFIWPEALDEPPYSKSSFSQGSDVEYLDGHGLSPEDELNLLNAEGENRAEIETNGKYLELDTPQYTGKIYNERIVEKLLAQAGIRLAATLNWLFAVMDEENGARVAQLNT